MNAEPRGPWPGTTDEDRHRRREDRPVEDKKRSDPSLEWEIRIERIRRYRQRSDPRGMTRPPRDPDERAFLRRTGQEGPYVELQDTSSAKGI